MVVSETSTNRYYFNDSVVRFCRGGDVEDLARSILDLYEDRELRQRLVQNAKEYVREYQRDVKKSIYLNLVDSITRSPKKWQIQ